MRNDHASQTPMLSTAKAGHTENGRGVVHDYTEALKWYRLSAEQGHANAQYNLAWLHQSGRGVPQDDVEAYMWFDLAALQGDPGEP